MPVASRASWRASSPAGRRSDGTSAGRPADHQAEVDRRHRVHLRDPQEPPQQPRPHRAQEVRPGGPQARRLPRGALSMAKKSKIARNDQRAIVVERYREKRLELKKALVDPNGTDESREEARGGLHKLPRNASPVRLRNRDAVDGRPRGHLSKFGISRVRFREMAHRGELPGITKSSW